MKMKIHLCILIISSLISNIISGQNNIRLERLLKEIPNIVYEEEKTDTFFTEKYVLYIDQPIDHHHHERGFFKQRVILSHLDADKPVVFITEGYGANYATHPRYINELSSILNANQICVEHRYFGESVPDPLQWEFLTVEQAANDHHKVVELLKTIYPGKWINTGISKGGQTAMYHRAFFPDDVDATVGYVCPLNFSTEDKRVYDFLDNVGDSICRQRIHDFQIELLSNRDRYFPHFLELAKEKGYHYSIGSEAGYELTVLEFSFAFWQWGVFDCDSIPQDQISPKKAVSILDKISGLEWVSDKGIAKLQPFFYQALNELGFYGYDIDRFDGLIQALECGTFEFSAPDNTEVVYNPATMEKVDSFIRHKATNMIFIYGEFDPWSATAVDLTYKTDNVINIIKPGGSHTTRINNLPDGLKNYTILKLNGMLNSD